jgi:putative ABC transport system permease protein
MKIARGLKISRKQLAAHKMRTALALLGIVIGVSTVIIMVSVGKGAENQVLSRIEAMGTNLIIVNVGQVQRTAGRQQVRGTVTTLTLEDAGALIEECPAVRAAAPVQSAKLQVKYESLATNTAITGTTADILKIRKLEVERGSFFGEEDNIGSRRVAVVGRTVVRNLFEESEPVGETIRIGKVPFEVIGVLGAKGSDLNGVDQDDQILIPINTALRRLFNIAYISTINIEAANKEKMALAQQQVREVLRERHRLNRQDKADDFTIQNQTDLIEAQRETAETFTVLIASIAGVSLLVGGIGILAIMLMAVKERTNEIGLRMAVGASRKDILVQFLLEASALSIGGGIVGIGTGLAGSLVTNAVTKLETSVSLASVILSFTFSIAVGLFFGVYPARKASRLDPITALRTE